MPEKNMLDEESEDVRRCRRVRQELFARFKTLDEMFDYCEQIRKRRGVMSAQARARGKAHAAARNGRPANNKPVHKA